MYVRKRGGRWLLLLTLACAGCRQSTPVEDLPGVRESLDAVGVRLGAVKSEHELTAAVTRQSQLLSWLKHSEREALGRNAVRFRSDAPTIVAVACPAKSAPFWLSDQGFRRSGRSIQVDGLSWEVHERTFTAGWVGLGVNGLDRTSDDHYAAFVRPATGGALALEALEVRPDPETAWRVVEAREGVSAASDRHRPIADLPAELDGSVLLQPAHDRRHAGVVAVGRIWKTHSASSPIPDQVSVSLGEDPAHRLVWSWRTSADVTKSLVRIAPAKFQTPEEDPTSPPELLDLRLVDGRSSTIRTSTVVNDPLIRRHTVVVDDLEPDTVYYYSVGDGSPERWGPWRTVRTGPARPKRLEFLYLGDAQTGFESWGNLLTAAYRRHPGLDFALLAGDLVDRGNERTNWDHFFMRAAPVFDRLPLMPAAGNHEYLDQGPRLYNSFFRLPQNGPTDLAPGLAYTFHYGGAFFAVLDGTSAVWSEAEAVRQAEWLDSALASTHADWKFVMFHHPIYPSHPWRDNPTLRKHWVPVFDRHHVDMVLQGHDHAYLRTPPMRNHQRVSTPADGTVYVVSVSGDKFVHDQPRREYIEVGRTDLSTYQTIEIDEPEGRLTYRSWTATGEIADSLVIQKSVVDDQRRSLVKGRQTSVDRLATPTDSPSRH
ncbi:metallophosphoesterase [Paludisphaera rhizosphaerae]|nr:metallophosphoesterase [Paludisphaera rhizosphaerae]